LNAAMPVNLLDFDANGMERFFAGLGEKPFRARQVLGWIHQRGADGFDAMTDIAKGLRAKLAASAAIEAPQVVGDGAAPDGTRKWMLKVDGANAIDTVYIPETGRGTLCVSSQAGCTLDCAFCLTGKQGFNRNLTTAEIIGQLWLAERLLSESAGARPQGRFREGRHVSNVVFMGMGEPMLNYDSVMKAIRLLCDPQGMDIAQRRITVSTAGVVPRIDDLGKEPVRPELAISLSATTNDLRDRLMPLNQRWPLEELLAACRRYPLRPRERITFEYVMLDGVNDSDQDAHRLPRLLHGIQAKVNLIPHNPAPELPFRSSLEERILRFQEHLRTRGIPAFIRKPRGQDIDAACGQLAARTGDQQWTVVGGQ